MPGGRPDLEERGGGAGGPEAVEDLAHQRVRPVVDAHRDHPRPPAEEPHLPTPPRLNRIGTADQGIYRLICRVLDFSVQSTPSNCGGEKRNRSVLQRAEAISGQRFMVDDACKSRTGAISSKTGSGVNQV
jgi:hypothetical protein